MVYRSDTDALEARLGVLEKDLADRTRERDDVARLLADAKATDDARRWLADAPRRRRRRWMIAGISLVVAVVAGFTTYRITHPRADKTEQAVRVFKQFAEEACTCVDKTCATAVTDRMTKWAQEMAKEAVDPPKPSDAQMKEMTEVAKRFSDCLTRAMQNDPSQTAEQPATLPGKPVSSSWKD